MYLFVILSSISIMSSLVVMLGILCTHHNWLRRFIRVLISWSVICKQACCNANILDFVNSLPELVVFLSFFRVIGWHHFSICSSFDTEPGGKGSQLSGGQKHTCPDCDCENHADIAMFQNALLLPVPCSAIWKYFCWTRHINLLCLQVYPFTHCQ